ncbi:MAG: efflux RND transporter periplasmic adaptor subunit, partial [Brevinematales bacterium]|nr:efflux RND transporter periplasmic adaptor subunit [Brevinematales bacterium]
IKQRMTTALSEVELAQSNLSKTNLYAPSYGILAEIIIQPGEFITPNDIVAKFISMGDANLEVEIPEKDVGQMKIGLTVQVNCDALPNRTFLGKLAEISPIVKEKTRTVVVKIRIPNTQGMLRSGMFARGEIKIQEIQNAIAVLKDSVISLGGETKLLPILKPIPDKENLGVVELRQITISQEVDKYIIITDGVNEEEYYITETTGELSDGIVVEYTEANQ